MKSVRSSRLSKTRGRGRTRRDGAGGGGKGGQIRGSMGSVRPPSPLHNTASRQREKLVCANTPSSPFFSLSLSLFPSSLSLDLSISSPHVSLCCELGPLTHTHTHAPLSFDHGDNNNHQERVVPWVVVDTTLLHASAKGRRLLRGGVVVKDLRHLCVRLSFYYSLVQVRQEKSKNHSIYFLPTEGG